MRIASTQYQAIMNQSLQFNQDKLSRLTQQMASGQRVMLPSDDPVDNVRLSRLQREESAFTQYRDNIAAVQIRLSKNEGYLQNMINDMMGGRDLLVWASDGGNAPADLQAMIQPLAALRDSLFYNANTIDQEGRYVFSGTATATAPMAYDKTQLPGSRYSFVGNTNAQSVVVGNGITQVANENLKGLENLLNQLDKTIATISAPTVDVNDPATRAIVMANLSGFDDTMDLLASKIAVMGGTQNILKTLDANHANVSLSNQNAINEIGQLDMAQAATELNGYQTALQATYKAYAKIGNLTLFAEL
ncbi:flagellar hook-associated protein FlgL [Massilia solisilvae]|uniref:Flagellar hook-associated protein FlgL n=1 Tax=Massilia solisilvae TaxID=1811225 RepID=A0ABT2BIR6_9BURK|nr:flagellar hook-associated protein FlgL [Massilia solisilvae]MCS0608311.1 flagellar hook-associated protein FlgL [Massilia solisilvae]